MSEPRLEDDIAFFGAYMCDDCGERHDDETECNDGEPDPDRMHDEMYEDQEITCKDYV